MTLLPGADLGCILCICHEDAWDLAARLEPVLPLLGGSRGKVPRAPLHLQVIKHAENLWPRGQEPSVTRYTDVEA